MTNSTRAALPLDGYENLLALLDEARSEIRDWERCFPRQATANDGATARLLSRIDSALSMQPEPVSPGTQQRRERWIQNIDEAIECGLPERLVRNLQNSKKEIERSIRYGGTEHLRKHIAELETARQTSTVQAEHPNS